jgi:N-acyl-L-homoserine lactone synthetase
MSHLDTLVTNEQVIPVIESELFAHRPDARFAIGVVAVGDEIIPGLEAEAQAYYRLRAGVYAYQTNMIDHGLVDENGTEHDHDDQRSLHFTVVENLGQAQRIVAAMRLIKKQGNNLPLPIEDFFPEVFTDNPAPENSLEVSRYICRHEDKRIQNNLKWPLYSLALSDIIKNDHAPTYAVVEEFLKNDFIKHGVPFTPIAEPKFVEEYNDENLGMTIDTAQLSKHVEKLQPGLLSAMMAAEGDFVYFGKQNTQPVEAA